MTNTMTVAIAGLGLIGGSLALKLVGSGAHVIAWNHRSKPYEAARARGIICVDTLQELAEHKPDVLFLCVPLRAMDDVLGTLANCLDVCTTLSDVGSVKREVLKSVTKHNLRSQFVGAHPMTGNELAGFEAADAGLFDHAVWAITAEEDTDFSRFHAVARVINEFASNSFILTNAERHDGAVAQISHMPHVVATALASELAENSHANIALALAAGSWRDMTRVAMTTPERTQAMVEENPDNVATLLKDMAARLNHAAALLENDNADLDELAQFFARADSYRQIRSRLSKGDVERVERLNFGVNDWKEILENVSAEGGRVQNVDREGALVSYYAHFER